MSELAESSENEDIEAIETKKSHKKKVSLADQAAREKKPRTEAQQKAFEACLKRRAECIAKRKADAERLAEFDRKALEEKVVKKAVAIKKKAIKKMEVLDDISSEEEEVKPKRAKTPVKPIMPFKFI